MAVTATATVLGAYTSRAAEVVLSSAAPGSPDIVTLEHNLGASLTSIACQIRSIHDAPSATPVLSVLSWNASVAVLHHDVSGVGEANAAWDVFCRVEHSITQ